MFWRGAPSQPYVDFSWDSASHVLAGLDLFDALRRLDLPAFFRTALTDHWWPPLFGLLTLPLHAVLGRSDLPARVLSAVSYAALPALCAAAVVSEAGRSLVAMAVGLMLTLVLYLTSPQLLEMSRWPMLEDCAAAMSLAAILAFCVSERPRWHRAAFVLAGLATLLKYHYGFFLLVTLGAGVILRIDPEERRNLGREIATFFRRPAIAVTSLIVVVLLALPVDAVRRTHWLPTAENVPWLGCVATIVLVLAVPRWRAAAHQRWRTLPTLVRDFVRFGMTIPAIWCLDPSNARVWYRQMRLASDPPALFDDQVHHLASFVTHDYLIAPLWLLPLIAVGIVALIVLQTRVTAVPLAVHGVWPIVLMTASRFTAEPRYIASLMAVLFAAAVLGWVQLLVRLRPRSQAATAVALSVVAMVSLVMCSVRAAEFKSRKTYHYRYTVPEGRFLETATPLLARKRPVLVVLATNSEVTPTLRLFLRLRMPDVAPGDVVVVQGGASDLASLARRFPQGIIAFDKRWEAPPDVRAVGEVPVPEPDGSTLLITERQPK
jgi:hypothetical protein